MNGAKNNFQNLQQFGRITRNAIKIKQKDISKHKISNGEVKMFRPNLKIKKKIFTMKTYSYIYSLESSFQKSS